ncbi:MAG: DUF1810 family protein [Solirubrobacteraceae bacterium]
MSRRYAISCSPRPRPTLRTLFSDPRLIECTRILSELHGPTAQDIFGGIDAVKLRSSMTLFAYADPDNPAFRRVLEGYFGGVPR